MAAETENRFKACSIRDAWGVFDYKSSKFLPTIGGLKVAAEMAERFNSGTMIFEDFKEAFYFDTGRA